MDDVEAVWKATPVAIEVPRLGRRDDRARSRRRSKARSARNLRTETADDFFLTDTTVIRGPTITGAMDAPFTNMTQVEIEVYHLFRWTWVRRRGT